MSQIIGDNGGLVNFTLSPGSSTQFWWYGFGADGIGYNVASAFPPVYYERSSRVVVSNNAMKWMEGAGASGVVYTADLSADDPEGTGAAAVFRMQIGQLG